MTKKAIPLLTLESQLKRRIRSHLHELGFMRTKSGDLAPAAMNKNTFRALHRIQRRDLLQREAQFIRCALLRYGGHFAGGDDVKPDRISPRIEIVSAGTWQSDLFRLAGLTWSVPVSNGYGRRMRFLVWDDYNGKLIGLIGLGDPVFNLRVRDEHIGWSAKDRSARLVNILDAFILGSVPPYNMILGGKLVAALIKTKEIRDAFNIKYRNTKGIISGKRKKSDLIAVTTTSALGRSSVYNRLKLSNHVIFESLGYTTGWGHFHISDELFSMMRRYLSLTKHKYFKSYEFGEGANWKIRVIKETLNQLGMAPSLLKHGVTREVFICKLASNAQKILTGKERRPNFKSLKGIEEMAGLARQRWMIPRSLRDSRYLNCKLENIKTLLFANIDSEPLLLPTHTIQNGDPDGARKSRYGNASRKGYNSL